MAQRKSTLTNFRYRLEYLCVRCLGFVCMILPLRLVYPLAKFFGYIAFHALRVRRDVTMENLRKSLGCEHDERRLKLIACRAYQNIGMTFMEMLIVPRLAGRIAAMVDMSGSDILRQAYGKGRGVILISCHFGSWEFNGAAIAALGLSHMAVAKKLANPFIDRLVYENRARLGLRTVSKKVVKEIVRAMRKGELIGLISDQDAGKNGVFVDFFGRKASTPRGGAELALKYGAAVIVSMMLRTGNGSYRNLFREVDCSPDDTVETLTQRFTKVMEDVIREYPEQYFWMHRRWKTVPPAGRTYQNSVSAAKE